MTLDERKALIWKTLAKHPEGMYFAALSRLTVLTVSVLHKVAT